jgi:hypothetical protein
MKKTIYLLLLILGTSSLSLLRASDESTNAISNKDIEIRIASNAVSVKSDTNATVLPSKEVIYKVKGSVNNAQPNQISDLYQTTINDLLSKIHTIASNKDSDGLVKLYEGSPTIMTNIVQNPKILDAYFKTSLQIQSAKWRFVVLSDQAATIFVDVASPDGRKNLMPFFFKIDGARFLPVYPMNPDTMTMNIIIAEQQNALSVSEK